MRTVAPQLYLIAHFFIAILRARPTVIIMSIFDKFMICHGMSHDNASALANTRIKITNIMRTIKSGLTTYCPEYGCPAYLQSDAKNMQKRRVQK